MIVHPSSTPLKRRRYVSLVLPAALLLILLCHVAAFAATSARKGAAARAEPAAPVKTAAVLNTLPAWGSLPTPSAPFDANVQEYVLIGFGRQGFQQLPSAGSPWTLARPAPSLVAQVIKRGEEPQNIVTNVRVSWELEPETVTVPKGAALRGDMAPAADGLSFTAAIPASPRRIDGVLNPYPVVTLTAVDTRTHKVLAQSAAVIAVSPGFGCATCHTGAGKTVLERHDKRHGTTLFAQFRKGETANCSSCHADDGSGKAGIGFSAALHGWHAPLLAGKNEDACLSCHIGLGRSASDDNNPPCPLFARDMHTERGLTCVNCHGTMEDNALGLLRAEEASGRAPAKTLISRITPRAVKQADEILPRQAWAQQPDCSACHDFASKPRIDASAFNSRTKDAAGLYAARTDDTGKLLCATCHGAPHALYPARNPVGRDRDNIVPLQYQQQAKALGAAGNCAMCHTKAIDAPAHHPQVERERTAIHLPADVRPTLPPVTVSHQAHAALDCKACHHTGREDGKSMACTRAGCHDLATAPSSDGKGTITDPRYFRNAFHGPGNSCFACHAEAQRTGKPAGPTACKDCHVAASPRWGADAPSKADVVVEPPTPSGNKDTAETMPPATGKSAPEMTPKEISQPSAQPAEKNGTR